MFITISNTYTTLETYFLHVYTCNSCSLSLSLYLSLYIYIYLQHATCGYSECIYTALNIPERILITITNFKRRGCHICGGKTRRDGDARKQYKKIRDGTKTADIKTLNTYSFTMSLLDNGTIRFFFAVHERTHGYYTVRVKKKLFTRQFLNIN